MHKGKLPGMGDLLIWRRDCKEDPTENPPMLLFGMEGHDYCLTRYDTKQQKENQGPSQRIPLN